MDRLVWFSNDVGVYVAHYTRFETALDLILKNHSLRFGPLIATNDPRETKMWTFAIATNLDLPEADLRALGIRHSEYDRILKYGCKVLYVSRDAEKAFRQEIPLRSYGKPRMWAQYSGNHTGVCLLFDKEELNTEIETTFQAKQTVTSGPVEYGDSEAHGSEAWMEYMAAFRLWAEDIVSHGIEAAVRAQRDKYLKTFFFRKNRDWENEAECRWLLRGKTNDPEFISIDRALRVIVLGVDFPAGRLAEITASETAHGLAA